MDCDKIRASVKGRVGSDIIYIESIDSTNRLSMDLCERGAIHGTVVIAGGQTEGRGRLGRRWASPAGINIYMSVILIPALKPKEATLLTILSSVACAEALREKTGLDIRIKWPNDLMCGDKKIGGILTEIRLAAGRILFGIIGIGINVNAEAGDFPSELITAATSVMIETSAKHEIEEIISSVLNNIEERYNDLLKLGRNPLLDEWREMSSTLGRRVSVSSGEETLTGVAHDIDDCGMLILEMPSGELRRVNAGDVRMLR